MKTDTDKKPEVPGKLIPSKDVAFRLSCCTRTVERISPDVLPRYYLGKRTVRFSEADVERMILQAKVAA